MNIEDARRSLPWYAVGALSGEEVSALEACLADSPELRLELRELQALHGAVKAQSASEPAFRSSLIADAWQRIDDYERSRRAAQSTRSTGLLSRLSQRVRHSLGELSVPGRWALATQLVVILTLTGIIIERRPESPAFSTASGTTAPTQLHGARFIVAFQPSASEAQIRDLLSTLEAQIVSGPTAEELYTVQLADQAAAEKVVGQLRSSPIVRFAAREGE